MGTKLIDLNFRSFMDLQQIDYFIYMNIDGSKVLIHTFIVIIIGTSTIYDLPVEAACGFIKKE